MVGCRAILMIAASFILPPMPSSSCVQSGKCCKCTGNDGARVFTPSNDGTSCSFNRHS